MKTIHILLVFTVTLLCSTTVSAQYGNNGYGNNGYGNNNGYGRNQMSQMGQNREPDKPKEIPVEVTVGKIMEKLKEELVLDQLQEIAISNVLIESIRSQGILLKAETSQEQKIKEIKALSEVTDRKVNEFLNEDQKAKYKALNEQSNNPKKSRKKR
ncbi:hypothetical protein [Flavobacterium degerlachei]|jgi:hypothetical protein|uniref:LTXXQ motif family protein n=1 Tax=Flavobacterium degerlachei TaxID=229203 RepID=A0A1H3DWQ1_9FLAO|nr:hypothetical protein [Flavobacterium degerlachei]SDX70124.1 hypothetical protein SAMN05444338_113122 [Flavobacterium degerlachei]